MVRQPDCLQISGDVPTGSLILNENRHPRHVASPQASLTCTSLLPNGPPRGLLGGAAASGC